MSTRTRTALATFLLVLGLVPPAAAAEWTLAGPDGGSIYSIALQPGSSNVLYAGTQAGVFKSVDGGATWLPPIEPPPMSPVHDIKVDPFRPATLYAVMGLEVFKSTDGGAHWTAAGQGLPSVNELAVTPGGVLYAGTGQGVFRSRDGGATWQKLGQGLPDSLNVTALAIDPSRPGRIYAGSFDRVHRSTDGGAHWTAAGGAALASGLNDLAVSPASSRIVYAATHSGVARSLDGGATWLPGRGLGFVRVVAAPPGLPGTVYAGTPEGVFKSTDQGRTWTGISAGLTDLDVQALVIDPAAPATLWAGTVSMARLGGVFRSTDAGAHWTFRSRGVSTVHVNALEVDPHTPGTLFAALGGFGLARSRDRGLHWTVLPLPPATGITDIEVDPVNPSVVYALRGAAGPLFRSTDGGDSWSPLATAPEVLFDLAIDPDDPSVLYGGGYGFHKSIDAGATWTRHVPSPPIVVHQIEIAPGGVLYAATSGQDPRLGLSRIFRSRDAGQTWEPLADGPTVLRLAVSPSNPGTVYVTNGSGIYRTTDGGGTWQQVSDLARALSLAIVPGAPETLYAAVSDQGVLASTDGGATWSPVGEGLEGVSYVHLVEVDPHDAERLYAGMANRGLAVLYQPQSCEAGTATLCLRGRFRVEVAWTDFQGNSGAGQAHPLTQETGAFWFFDPDNLELIVKILDGRGTNGRFWVFAASLTSVEFTLTVTDIETGKQRVYHNPSGHMASFADTEAF